MSMDLFDLHCDTITVCSSKNLELRRNDLHISLERLLRIFSFIFRREPLEIVDRKTPPRRRPPHRG